MQKEISNQANKIGNLEYELMELRRLIPLREISLMDMKKRLEELPGIIERERKYLARIEGVNKQEKEEFKLEKEIVKLQRRLKRART